MVSKQPYFYNIGYVSHEDSCSISLFSSTKYTKKDLFNVMTKCITEVVNKHGICDGNEPRSYDEVFNEFRIDLIKQLAQRDLYELEYTSEWVVFGWADINKPDSWEHCPGDMTYDISVAVLRALELEAASD